MNAGNNTERFDTVVIGMKWKLVVVLIGLLALMMATGVAYADKPVDGVHNHSDGDDGGPVRTTDISMEKTKFVPRDVIASFRDDDAVDNDPTGVTITWTNNDRKNHDVHVHDLAGKMVAHSPVLARGESWSFTFNSIGIYNIHCDIHPRMKGTVTIES